MSKDSEIQHTSNGPPSSDSSTLQGERGLKSHVTFKDEETGNGANENFSSTFALSPDFLHELVSSKQIEKLRSIGGLSGLESALRTDLTNGLNADEDSLQPLSGSPAQPIKRRQSIVHIHLGEGEHKGFSTRRNAYSDNTLPPRKSKSFLRLVFDAFNDKLMFLLTFSAVISLSLGIYQSVDPSEPGSNVEWVEGVTIVIAILIILMATATNDWQKNRKFEKLNRKKDEKFVNVVRSGKINHISSNDILVGDVVRFETGDIVPVDGILTEGFDIETDESSTTGESDLIEKTPFTDPHPSEAALRPTNIDPFILSGSKVANGVGSFVATSVGVNSSYGRVLMSLRDEPQVTPLQQKLGSLAKYILLFGALFGVLFFFILLVRFLVRLDSIEGGPRAKGEEFLELFMLSVTMVVIGVPEGLALAVTLALAFATTRMLKDNNLVRLLRSCEIMGNATTICSDKTGTLTQNKMTVVSCRVGLNQDYEDLEQLGPADGNDPTAPVYDRTAVQPMALISSLGDAVRELLNASIYMNTTATDKGTDKMELQGSSTEKALVQFAADRFGLQELTAARNSMETVHLFPFQSTQKSMAAIVELPNGKFRMFAKGAAEIVLSRCTNTLEQSASGLSVTALDQSSVELLHEHISRLAHRSLRVLALSYRDFDSWPPPHETSTPGTTDHLRLDHIFQDMTLASIVGLRDPLRPDVIDSVRQCQKAGVFVRMVTGDNPSTAISIAKDCGIYTPGGIAMDGPTFRKLTPAQLDMIVPRLQVLARSSPEDKRVLVYRLRAQKEIVAVTGDGTNDALALKAADVGFAMGIAGTEVAKEASSIILMDDNFTSIVRAVQWGRTVNDAVKKFLQFQLTINFSAGLLTAVTALVGEVDEAVFTVVQLLWVNIIMDTFAALSLATDYPTRGVLQRKPEPRGQAIITVAMWKMIIAQTLYQMGVIFVLHYAGRHFWASGTEHEQRQLQTTAFNTYIWLQLFNQWNSRMADSRFNIFEGMHRNPWFFFVQVVTVTGQTLIVMFGGNAFQTARPTGTQWAASIILGVLTLPLGALVRTFPDRWFLLAMTPVRKLFHLRMRRRAVKREKKAKSPPQPGFLSRAMSVIKRETKPPAPIIPTNEDTIPPTAEELKLHRTASRTSLQRQSAKGEIDLSKLIGAARQGKKLSEKYVFEVHPGTAADDPLVLVNVDKVKAMNTPPSQDPDHLMYLSSYDDNAAMRRESRGV
ncbi:calcium-translocating P-type ATPase, PMCA-type [Cyphellophora europaea CBS 101466]|uniref:Calcium-transporting ATPase n=1 Tax=Cyphellophora europaea (strain CBS 101466) TaxID=1220924 RepID=W2S205_CYPE1|nr:calcium-translocating P-type ATPase, PMCA-type [Cyphellophora europaea CBS 101466]ETN42746.1 calcium-translocating P-type ATPase, PMCA-type [Cyphellophora europaea CBS 101466]